jgi:hypothetical protein
MRSCGLEFYPRSRPTVLSTLFATRMCARERRRRGRLSQALIRWRGQECRHFSRRDMIEMRTNPKVTRDKEMIPMLRGITWPSGNVGLRPNRVSLKPSGISKTQSPFCTRLAKSGSNPAQTGSHVAVNITLVRGSR